MDINVNLFFLKILKNVIDIRQLQNYMTDWPHLACMLLVIAPALHTSAMVFNLFQLVTHWIRRTVSFFKERFFSLKKSWSIKIVFKSSLLKSYLLCFNVNHVFYVLFDLPPNFCGIPVDPSWHTSGLCMAHQLAYAGLVASQIIFHWQKSRICIVCDHHDWESGDSDRICKRNNSFSYILFYFLKLF